MQNGLDKLIKIERSLEPNNYDIDFLTQQINHETSEIGSAYPFAFFARNERDEIVAGCNGSVIFGSIYTDQLWVHPEWRKKNLGQKLMEHVHDYGCEIGCHMAIVSTMSFQNSREFYEKLGYEVDFERSGYINNSSCFLLRRELKKHKTKFIQLASYNDDWPRKFEVESIKIKEALGDNCSAVHDEYADLKKDILRDSSSSEKNNSIFPTYTLRKNDFILSVLKKSGFNRLRFVKCTFYSEIDAYHRIKEEQIFRPINVDYDPNHLSLTLDNHFHFILYNGMQIVSIAHIEFLNQKEVALRALATDATFQNQRFGSYMINLLEKWVRFHGRKIIKLHTRASSETFFRKVGYTEMHFNNLSITEDVIDLGKLL
ncbi:MAG: GNAT family N-acetyltransferase [Rickettsiaceae bacterium]